VVAVCKRALLRRRTGDGPGLDPGPVTTTTEAVTMSALVMVVPGGGVPSEAAVRWAAERTVSMHTEPAHQYIEARCQQCPHDVNDCPQWRWARAYIAMRTKDGQP
jgi:hypothetical protein